MSKTVTVLLLSFILASLVGCGGFLWGNECYPGNYGYAPCGGDYPTYYGGYPGWYGGWGPVYYGNPYYNWYGGYGGYGGYSY